MNGIQYIVLTFKFKQEGKKWTAYCEELGTATFGSSLKDAQEKLKEAVLLHLNTLERVGECRNFFAEHNIQVFTQRPKSKELTLSGPFDTNTYSSPYVYPIHNEMMDL